MYRWIICGALLLALAGCGSFKDDLRAICFAPEDPVLQAELAELAPDARQKRMGQYMEERVRTSEGRRLMEALAHASPSGRNELLAKEARKAGLDRCPIAEQGAE